MRGSATKPRRVQAGGALPLPAAPPSLPVPLPTGRSQQPSGFGEKCGAGEASEPGAKPLPGWDRALLPSHPSDLALLLASKIWWRNGFYLQLRAPGGSITQKFPLGRALLKAPIVAEGFRIPKISHGRSHAAHMVPPCRPQSFLGAQRIGS